MINNLKISSSLGVFSHLENSTDKNIEILKNRFGSPKSEKKEQKDAIPDYLICSPRNENVNKKSEPLSTIL